jgi:hypothetical protein
MIAKSRFVLPFVLAATIAAQGRIVVPAIYADAEAPSAFGLPGIGGSERMQIIVDGAHLSTLIGRRLNGLSVRRNADWGEALASAQGQLIVRVGAAAHAAADARPDFAANLPVGVEVHRGSVQAPQASAVSGYAGWASGQTITIPFAVPFDYLGGPLCIELEGSGSAADWWPIDGVEDRNAGMLRSVGRACGPRAQVLGSTAGASAADLVVGETVHLGFFGEARSLAMVMFGDDVASVPTDLALIGAPGCELWVLPFATAAVALSEAVAGEAFGGVGEFLLHLPADSGLLGARFAVQWLEFLPSGIATSNALVCDLASAPPGLGMATVWAKPGNAPVVDFTAAPVLGLLWQ